MVEKLDKDAPVISESDRVKRQRELADLDQDFVDGVTGTYNEYGGEGWQHSSVF